METPSRLEQKTTTILHCRLEQYMERTQQKQSIEIESWVGDHPSALGVIEGNPIGATQQRPAVPLRGIMNVAPSGRSMGRYKSS